MIDTDNKPFLTEDTDFEVRSLDAMCVNQTQLNHPWWHQLKYLVAGVFLGILLVKSEAVSWYRIQEMFRFQSFHMYGLIGSAIAVGMSSIFLIKKFSIKTIHREKIEFQQKKFNKGNVYGGLLFGVGWAMTGACPGPLFAQIGAGAFIIAVPLVSAILGTWAYGLLREKLPH